MFVTVCILGHKKQKRGSGNNRVYRNLKMQIGSGNHQLAQESMSQSNKLYRQIGYMVVDGSWSRHLLLREHSAALVLENKRFVQRIIKYEKYRYGPHV